MAEGNWPGNLRVDGHFTPRTMSIPNGTITDAMVSAAAAISASKLEHQFAVVANVRDARETLHLAYGATGSVVAVRCGLVTPCTGTATVTVDVLKNGSSILTAAVVIDVGDAAFAVLSATIDAAEVEYVAGDVFEVTVVSAAGNGVIGQGLFVQMVVREKAAP